MLLVLKASENALLTCSGKISIMCVMQENIFYFVFVDKKKSLMVQAFLLTSNLSIEITQSFMHRFLM